MSQALEIQLPRAKPLMLVLLIVLPLTYPVTLCSSLWILRWRQHIKARRDDLGEPRCSPPCPCTALAPPSPTPTAAGRPSCRPASAVSPLQQPQPDPRPLPAPPPAAGDLGHVRPFLFFGWGVLMLLCVAVLIVVVALSGERPAPHLFP